MAVTSVPYSQVTDAHKLDADGMVSLFKIEPVVGGALYLKHGAEYEYLGNLYEGLPIQIRGEKWSADTSTPTPRCSIGQEDVDLLPFKGLVHDGYMEAARITRYQVLLDDMLNQVDSKRTTVFKVKRVESYSRAQIVMLLSTLTGAANQSYPFRQYTPPAFPWVNI
jgi:hypothetical protein